MITGYFDKQFNNLGTKRQKIRNLYQLLIIDELFESKFRNIFVLKGLAAAFLTYGISEGSDTIEIVTLDEIKIAEVEALIDKITKKFSNIRLKNITEKRYSNLIQLEVKDTDNVILDINVEITKIKYQWKRSVNFDIKLISVKDWTYKVIGQVVTLNEIIKDHPDLEIFKNIKFNLS